MQNLALTVLLAEQKRHQCPCGAVAERRSGLCRKCQSRNAWRRKTASTHRKAARRRGFARRIRDVAWFLTEVLFLVPALSAGRGC